MPRLLEPQKSKREGIFLMVSHALTIILAMLGFNNLLLMGWNGMLSSTSLYTFVCWTRQMFSMSEEQALRKILSLPFTRELICSFMVAGAIVRAFFAEEFLPRESMKMAQRLNGIDAALSIFYIFSIRIKRFQLNDPPLLNVEWIGWQHEQ